MILFIFYRIPEKIIILVLYSGLIPTILKHISWILEIHIKQIFSKFFIFAY